MIYDPLTCGIAKKIVNPGFGGFPQFVDGTKIVFHYQTRLADDESAILDDSKKVNKPLELVIGKKFKYEVWEKCVKTMSLGEVSSFTVIVSLCQAYPMFAKQLRDINRGLGHQRSCCGVMATGLGYPDLDDLMKQPKSLTFIFELVSVQGPSEYEQEGWLMNEEAKVAALPRLREDGNILFNNKQYKEAAHKYYEAIEFIDELQLKEKPHDAEWDDLNVQKVPYYLNLSQCELFLEDYYQAIEHTTEVLDLQSDNVKALFRRAKAHTAVWNLTEARNDLEKVLSLDPSLHKTVHNQLKVIHSRQKDADAQSRDMFGGKLLSQTQLPS